MTIPPIPLSFATSTFIPSSPTSSCLILLPIGGFFVIVVLLLVVVFSNYLWIFQVTDYCKISSVVNLSLRTCGVRWRGGRWRGNCQLGRYTNQVKKCKLIKKMFLHSDLLTSLSFLLTQLCFTIRKLMLRGNGLKRQRAINQSKIIMHTFDLRQNLPKYLRNFLNKF